MSTLKIDLLVNNQAKPMMKAPGGRPVRRSRPFLVLAGVFILSFVGGRFSLSASATAALADLPIIKQMHLIGSPDRRLYGEAEDRVNILLLGMGGEGHEGPLLTDTIMVVSFKPSTGKVALLSIPRDLLVPLTDAGWQKINAANAFGEMKSPGHGADYARSTVEGLLGLDLPYYIRVDFQGFEKMINDIDGVDVVVDRPFVDRSYPAANFQYQIVSFKAGEQHLDGATALQFARSRHGTNGEGSDFARAKRQQKVIAAVKDKALTFNLLKNPARISNLLADLQANIATNLQVGEILRLAKMTRGVQPTDIVHQVLDDGPKSPLTATYVNGAYVLVPRRNDWSEVRQAAADVFATGTSDIAASTAAQPAATPTTPAVAEKIRIEIRNGSGQAGLAREMMRQLTDAGFTVIKFGNADSFTYAKTTVYDLTNGRKAAALDDLKTALGRGVKTVVPPSGRADAAPTADFMIILGQDNPGQG